MDFRKLMGNPTIAGILSKLTNYSHTAIGTGYAITALAYHIKSGHDLGANFVSFSYAFFGFLAGHAFVYQKWPDATPDATPTAPPDGSKG